VFRSASPELVRRYAPDFAGSVFVHNLQAYLVGRVTRPLLERYLPTGGVAVDLGCGSGTTVKEMSARAATAIGVDVDDSSFGKHPELSVVAAGERDLDDRRGAFLVRASLNEVPVRDESVDFVTSRWVFEHLEDPSAAVREIRRILKPGGVVLLVVPNRFHPGIFVSSLLPLRAKQVLLRSSSAVEEEMVLPTYYRINSGRSLDRHFERAGFERLALHYVSDPSYWLFSGTLFRGAMLLGRIANRLPLRRFRMHIVGAYRKEGMA
jgi:SAM-dependent methyltransferase